MKKHLLHIIACFIILPVFAQSQESADSVGSLSPSILAVKSMYEKDLADLKKKLDNWKYNGQDTLSNPYYFQLFSSQTRYDGPLRSTIGSLGESEKENSPVSSHAQHLNSEIDRVLSDVYANNPSLITHAELMTDGENGLRNDLNEEVLPGATTLNDNKNEIRVDELDVNLGDVPVEVVVHKPNFWKFPSNFSLQFMQYYVTDNWYKGGESNNSLLAALEVNANYDNKQKITFENKLEMKLGFQTTKIDKGQQYKTNADLLRLTNKLGVRAAKHWKYTIMLQSWTQFYKTFDGNRTVTSDFMSPFESLFSVGMEYKIKKQKFELKDITLSPVALKVKYVDRLALSERFGIEKDKHCKIDVGSTVTINYSWDIFKQVRWEGRIYYFTNYHKTQIDWENTLKLTINKYLTTKLFLYPRFDDSIKRDEGEKDIEFNEWISVGLELNF